MSNQTDRKEKLDQIKLDLTEAVKDELRNIIVTVQNVLDGNTLPVRNALNSIIMSASDAIMEVNRERAKRADES